MYIICVWIEFVGLMRDSITDIMINVFLMRPIPERYMREAQSAILETRTHAHTHARARARARTHTHTHTQNFATLRLPPPFLPSTRIISSQYENSFIMCGDIGTPDCHEVSVQLLASELAS